MAYPTFYPPFAPLAPLEDQVTPRRITAQFGDGYTQFTADGLNPEVSNPQLVWEPLTATQGFAMEAFFEANAGLPFYYALATDGVTKAWTASQWQLTRGPTYYTMTATFAQQFPLGLGANVPPSLNFSVATNAIYLGLA
jgi:phage-related protein